MSTSDCQDKYEELLLWYANGTLELELRGELESHTATCESCRDCLAFALQLHSAAQEQANTVIHIDSALLLDYCTDRENLSEGTIQSVSSHVAACAECIEIVRQIKAREHENAQSSPLQRDDSSDIAHRSADELQWFRSARRSTPNRRTLLAVAATFLLLAFPAYLGVTEMLDSDSLVRAEFDGVRVIDSTLLSEGGRGGAKQRVKLKTEPPYSTLRVPVFDLLDGLNGDTSIQMSIVDPMGRPIHREIRSAEEWRRVSDFEEFAAITLEIGPPLQAGAGFQLRFEGVVDAADLVPVIFMFDIEKSR